MPFNNPTIPDFKDYFVRDFPFGTDFEKDVLDADIAKAMAQCRVNLNQDLFPDQSAYSIGYNLLTANFLVMNLRASSQGINGQFAWLQNSKSVGAVSEAFSIPQRILDNPYFAIFTKTNYGLQYLQMVLPSLAGQVFGAYGPARAL